MKLIYACKELRLIGDLATWLVSEEDMEYIRNTLKRKNLDVTVVYKDECKPNITMQSIRGKNHSTLLFFFQTFFSSFSICLFVLFFPYRIQLNLYDLKVANRILLYRTNFYENLAFLTSAMMFLVITFNSILYFRAFLCTIRNIVTRCVNTGSTVFFYSSQSRNSNISTLAIFFFSFLY